VALNRQNQRFEDNSLLLKTSGLVHLIDYSSTASNLQIPSFSQRLTNALRNGNKPCAFACRRRRLEAGLRTKDRAVTISGSGKNRILSNHSCLVCSGACIRAWKTSTVLAHLIICLSTILSNTSVSHISLRGSLRTTLDTKMPWKITPKPSPPPIPLRSIFALQKVVILYLTRGAGLHPKTWVKCKIVLAIYPSWFHIESTSGVRLESVKLWIHESLGDPSARVRRRNTANAFIRSLLSSSL
jgi:hypothetical protein